MVYEYRYVEKADLSKGYQNPKRKLGVTTHFSEITELRLCGSRKYPYLPHGWFFTLKPPNLSGNSSLTSYFPLKLLAFETFWTTHLERNCHTFYVF